MSLLIDTDVLIDYFRGNSEAASYMDGLTDKPLISVITVAELYAGVREGAERAMLDQAMSAFEIIPLDGTIAERGGLFRRDYGKSDGVALADALIAATADARGVALVTLNRKHFPMLPHVIVPYRKQ